MLAWTKLWDFKQRAPNLTHTNQLTYCLNNAFNIKVFFLLFSFDIQLGNCLTHLKGQSFHCWIIALYGDVTYKNQDPQLLVQVFCLAVNLLLY